MDLDTLASAGVPAIALINFNGYRHFVVIKGIREDGVLLRDPALGLRTLPRAQFESMWENGRQERRPLSRRPAAAQPPAVSRSSSASASCATRNESTAAGMPE